MLGYPYTYNDYLSEEEAMQRRVDFFDRFVAKGLVFVVFWSLIPTPGFAADLPANRGIAEAPNVAPVFAPIAGICKCTSPQVKTAMLLMGISSLCYCAFCTKDKPLIIACTSLATYVAIQLK